MSLKARIEAVIYAAEDPVTLAQLASLFRDEALARRAARVTPEADAAASSEEDAEALADELLPPSPDAAGVAAELSSPTEREAQPSERAGLERAVQREVRDEIRTTVDELIAEYNSPDRGLEIREVAGGFRIGTRPEVHDAVRAFIKTLKPPLKLSLQALETLAVIAYKQPVTAPEIGEIRGVDSGGVLGSLIARKLITTAGRKQVIGRPILYKTTREFLLRFGLRDVNELPSIDEFEKMAADLEEATEFEDSAEGIPPSAQDPKEPAPPMNDPEPEVPEPPIGEPPAQPEPAPTTEMDAALEDHKS
ncbi:MAG TPA: SMC-Scp complex subunit ScpB [Acidobacteriaceae bacterium]|jgi:segregation and condensation protein B|nr:SMC-Scp complex subunit ScpB [Acidobacteriaceae bacterium]